MIVWNRFSALQLFTLALASIAPTILLSTIVAGIAGLISEESMIEVALGAGENPGMLTFGAMFLCSPVQAWTGRSQVRVRKYLGIVFFLLALSNGAMFALERGAASALDEPLLIAGSLALAFGLPLFATSNRWSQRRLGMARWRTLHRLTYVIAIALLAHVALVGDVGPGAAMIAAGFIARLPAVKNRLARRSSRRLENSRRRVEAKPELASV